MSSTTRLNEDEDDGELVNPYLDTQTDLGIEADEFEDLD